MLVRFFSHPEMNFLIFLSLINERNIFTEQGRKKVNRSDQRDPVCSIITAKITTGEKERNVWFNFKLSLSGIQPVIVE